MSERSDPSWPVSWSEVREAQLRDWLRATPAQRLAWMEEMLEFARLAGVLPRSVEAGTVAQNQKKK